MSKEREICKQERNFLLLKDDEESKIVREILKSPLGLAEALIVNFIECKLDSLKEKLDSIKQFAAGVASAEGKSPDYTLAMFYPYYFAFHQFVHSSFRARQGKVLEGVFDALLRDYRNIEILDKASQRKLLGISNRGFPDFDLFMKIAKEQNDEYLIVQIRSRDDTGGTTAKTSLVEGVKYLREHLCKSRNRNKVKINYVVFVWEELNSLQRDTTLNKFYNFLCEEVKNLDKETFKDTLLQGNPIQIDCVDLYFIYGLSKFLELLKKIVGLSNDLQTSLRKLLNLIMNWDDFWVAYSVIGKEYERYKQFNRSFIYEMIDFLKKENFDFEELNTYEDYRNLADKIAVAFWKQEKKGEPFERGQDNYLYFKDIAFLILIYYKKKGLLNKNLIIPKYFSFRKHYSNISNNYITHRIYYYPASFIPQVVRYTLDKFSKENCIVLDMFAGGGTVGVESYISNRNSILIDINPLLPELIKLKLFNKPIDTDKLLSEANDLLMEREKEFYPNWKNIDYWYAEPILNLLTKIWGNLYDKDYKYKLILKYALLYISRKFSNADNSVPKLFSSKKKRDEINKILKENWKEKIKNNFIQRVIFIKDAISELQNIKKKNKEVYCKVFTEDSYSLEISNLGVSSLDLIITSPPYLQAQEYVRSIKLDLYWSGYDDTFIRELSKKEIPYRKIDTNMQINTPLLEKIKKYINYDSLSKEKKRIFDSYFYYTIKTIEKYSSLIKENGKLCIFVGNPKMNGTEINIWEIFLDYFTNSKNFKLLNVIADPIISRKLASKRKNNNPNGMEYEYLIILKRK
jgi:DNA modification methylase